MSDSKSSRVGEAYERLKHAILSNALRPGYQATEPEVAADLGMSRTPVREALIRLAAEGLVEVVPRRGVRVLAVSPSDMEEIYQLLTLLEPEAAAAVASAGLREEDARALEDTIEAMERGLAADDLSAWADADDRFHRTLLNCSPNGRLKAFAHTLFDQAHRARLVTLYLRERPNRSTAEHREILGALRAGDADATRTRFRTHRQRAANELLAVLQDRRLEHV